MNIKVMSAIQAFIDLNEDEKRDFMNELTEYCLIVPKSERTRRFENSLENFDLPAHVDLS